MFLLVDEGAASEEAVEETRCDSVEDVVLAQASEDESDAGEEAVGQMGSKEENDAVLARASQDGSGAGEEAVEAVEEMGSET